MRRAIALWGLLLTCVAATGRDDPLGGAAVDLQEASAKLASGETTEALQRTLAAAAAIAQTLPLGIARAELVRERTLAYATEVPRADARFAVGEPMLVYLEPVGCRIDTAGGTVFFGFAVDIALLDGKGAPVAQRRDFGSWTFRSRRPSLETFVTLAVATGGLPPGDYRLELTLRDLVDPSARATTTLPVTLLEGARPQAASDSPAPSRAAISSR